MGRALASIDVDVIVDVDRRAETVVTPAQLLRLIYLRDPSKIGYF
jgi:hypothetical protein